MVLMSWCPSQFIFTVIAFFSVFSTAEFVYAQSSQITIATWGGVYGTAQETAILKPFTRATGIGVRVHQHGGDFQPILEEGRSPGWAVVDVEHDVLTKGCADGHFEKLDIELLLGSGALADFLPGTLHPCGVGSVIWSEAIVYDATVFKGAPPRSMSDFFDLEKFPGQRGLFAGGEGNLEIALMADGVRPSDIYDVLRKPGGVDQAFAKLNTIRLASVFWSAGDEPEQLLNEGQVVMTTGYAARFLRPRQGARRPAKILWSNQRWRAAYWAIPEGQDDIASAQRFLTFATDAARLADLAARLRYGPARRSGLEAVPENLRMALPTTRAHFHDALQIDSGFWNEFGPAIEKRFRQWRIAQP